MPNEEKNSLNFAVQTGVAILLAAVFAVVGVSVVDSGSFEEVWDVSNQSEWEEGSFTDQQGDSADYVEVQSDSEDEDYITLSSGETTGGYESEDLDEDADQVEFDTEISEPDNSTLDYYVLNTDGDEVSEGDLEDGENTVEFDDTEQVESVQLFFDRDDDTIDSPRVYSHTGLLSEDTLLPLLAGLAFTLLLLGALITRYRQYNGFE